MAHESELIRSIRDGDEEQVALFLETGLNPDLVDEEGTPILLIASQLGNLFIVKKLLEYGADINIKNNHGTTALMAAVVNEHIDVIRLLLDNNADINHIAQGETAFSVAEQIGNYEIMLLILSRRFNLDNYMPKITRLVEIGTHQDTVGPGYEYQESYEAETKEIGEILNNGGGFDLMLLGHAKVKRELGNVAARRLERVWGGIGIWQS
jgi:ankyrin repeat protein